MDVTEKLELLEPLLATELDELELVVELLLVLAAELVDELPPLVTVSADTDELCVLPPPQPAKHTAATNPSNLC
jgi:hypothetical protein